MHNCGTEKRANYANHDYHDGREHDAEARHLDLHHGN
jgi:hypothetical protein